MKKAAGILLRSLLPLALLIGGWVAFYNLSRTPEKPQLPPAKSPPIRTRVSELTSTDHQVLIQSSGMVEPHNQVNLSSEVAGKVTTVNSIFESGSYFTPQDVLVEIDPSDYQTALAVATAQRNAAASALELAEQEYRRKSELQSTSAIADAEMDQAKANVDQARSQLDTATANIEKSTRDIQRTRIRAPFAGRVRDKSVGLGQIVGSGTLLGTIFAVDFAEVRLPISSRQLQFLDLPEHPVDPAIDVELRDAIHPESSPTWKGSIVRTEGVVDENSLETYAIARIDDPFGIHSGNPPLRIGQPVTATIRGKKLQDVVALPRHAVRQLDRIYLVDPQTLKIRGKKIQAVWSDSDSVYVRDPELAKGLWLATTRIVFAPDGASVEIIPEMEGLEDALPDAPQNTTN
ncbi:MAG: efflux RND transporter periplasmic adaptor subunit [Planctomycetota bacterium]|nr:efflux RND transporter periplasmic adaptor subunit [Planctomycetota bacterium]